MRPPTEISVFLLSLFAPGVLYSMNNIPALQQPLGMLGLGMVVLGSVLLLLLLTVSHKQKLDPLFYVFSEFSFTCLMALTNALEQDGFIRGFMDFYLKTGEPHLSAAYSVMMCYWDGVVHFVVFLLIIHRMFRGKSYRELGLLWAGSSIASQLVVIPGTVIGKYGSNIRPAFLRNLPFFLVPFWAASLLLGRPREMPIIPADKVAEEQKRSLFFRPVDAALAVAALTAMAFTVFRGFVVLDCPLDTCFTYIYQYEPYLKDPVGFPRVMPGGHADHVTSHSVHYTDQYGPQAVLVDFQTMYNGIGANQMLGYLFYVLPLLVACVYGLSRPGCSWMLDWTLILVGAVTQTQWCHIGASFHPRTPFTYRVPADKWWPVVVLNVLYVAVPVLLALRCHVSPTYFMTPVTKGQTDADKKKK